jgi:hypothetical protein
MSEVHNILTESAYGGHTKTYNRITSTYYWLRMSRVIKRYVSTCDICQKSKPKCRAPFGLLQPIPILTQPFEVVSMDFIPELPLSDGFDNIFVIVDKLTSTQYLSLPLLLLVKGKQRSCSSTISFQNSEYLDKLFWIETLGGRETSGKKYATEWEWLSR